MIEDRRRSLEVTARVRARSKVRNSIGNSFCTRPLLLSVVGLVLALVGCASRPPCREEPAVTIAKQVALRELGWKKVRAECARAENGGWQVTLWMLPERPGGFFDFDVSADGRVTAMHPGN